jgi:hypothetical protein
MADEILGMGQQDDIRRIKRLCDHDLRRAGPADRIIGKRLTVRIIAKGMNLDCHDQPFGSAQDGRKIAVEDRRRNVDPGLLTSSPGTAERSQSSEA